MNDTPTIAAVRGFLRMLIDTETPSEERLAESLDRLAMAYYEAPEGEPAKGDRSPPEQNFKDRYASLAERFPQLGMYAVADPTKLIDTDRMCGDAIDDLTDIEGDLSEVLWRFDNVGADDAHWYFKLLYRNHWGRHLRELAFYLHAKIW